MGASAANAYTHLSASHKEVDGILEPIIADRASYPNKCARPVASRKVDEMFKAASQRSFRRALLKFFVRPTATKNVVENDTFRDLFHPAGANVDISTIKTLSKWINDEFLRVLGDIGSLVSSAEFYVLTFDWWTTCKNAALFSFTIAFLCMKLRIFTKSVANLLLPGSHDAVAVSNAIHKIVTERLSMRCPAFFVTDNTNLNPAAVRRYMNTEGDEFWFGCSVHLAQLAMRSAVIKFMGAPPASAPSTASVDEFDWNNISKLDDDTLKDQLEKAQTCGCFARIVATARAVRPTLNRCHKRRERFDELQGTLRDGTKTKILYDVKTRFNSTLDMFESVVLNLRVLLRLQELSNDEWPMMLHFSGEDFGVMRDVTEILKPIRAVTKELGKYQVWVGNMLPAFYMAYESVKKIEAFATAAQLPLRNYVLEQLGSRMKELYEGCFPSKTVATNPVTPNEYVVAAVLDPCACAFIENALKLSQRSVCSEMKHLETDWGLADGSNDGSDDDDSMEVEIESNVGNSSNGFGLPAFLAQKSTDSTDAGFLRLRPSVSPSVRVEFDAYMNEYSKTPLKARHGDPMATTHEFWASIQAMGKWPRLCRIPAVFLLCGQRLWRKNVCSLNCAGAKGPAVQGGAEDSGSRRCSVRVA